MSAARRATIAALFLGALLATGAPVARAQTVNIEVDWMVAGDHNHKPAQSEIDAVTQMFACHGITLNVVLDQAIPETALLSDSTFGALFVTDSLNTSTFASLRKTYFNHRGQAGWHYCIFGHQYQIGTGNTGSSGISELPGYGFLVAMGAFPDAAGKPVGTPWERASSFAHELGHNFGLTHAGPQDEALTGPAIPVYPSIMSYMYQLRGVKTHMECLGLVGSQHLFKDLDYSNGRLPTENENALDESQGLGIVPVDWNCDGATSGIVAHALNDTLTNGYWCNAKRTRYVLNDRDDWAIVLNSIAHPPAPATAVQAPEPCISHQEVLLNAFSASSCAIVEPTPVNEACTSAQMDWVDSTLPGLQLGTGTSPFTTLSAAVAAAPAGSILYVRPGTWNIGGTGVISKPLVITGAQPFTVVP